MTSKLHHTIHAYDVRPGLRRHFEAGPHSHAVLRSDDSALCGTGARFIDYSRVISGPPSCPGCCRKLQDGQEVLRGRAK